MSVEVKPMEIKKNKSMPIATTKDKTEGESWNTVNPAQFVGEIKEEINKITWTNPEELKVYTQIVVGATFFCGMGIYLLDLFIQTFLVTFSGIFRFILG